LLHVVHDTDDLRLYVEAGDVDAFADRTFAGEIRARENVIDVDDERRAFVVLRRHKTPVLETDAHRLPESAFDEIAHRLRHVVEVRRLRPSVDPERQRRVVNHRA
jgi:hypothetical protein